MYICSLSSPCFSCSDEFVQACGDRSKTLENIKEMMEKIHIHIHEDKDDEYDEDKEEKEEKEVQILKKGLLMALEKKRRLDYYSTICMCTYKFVYNIIQHIIWQIVAKE